MNLNHYSHHLAKEYSDKEWSGAVNLIDVEDHIVLIIRSKNVSTHKGQVALLGGHKESLESPLKTAQREFEEETLLNSQNISYQYYLDSVRTGGGKRIIPVCGTYQGPKNDFLQKAKSNGEWDHLILVPKDYLGHLDNWQRVKTNYQTGDLYFVPILSGNYLTKDPAHRNFTLWGATAKMLWYYFDF